MYFSIICVNDVKSKNKTRIINWLSLYLEKYFADRDYGEGIQHLCITVDLSNGIISFEELQEMYVPEFKSKFDTLTSTGDMIEGKNHFSFTCLFTDEEYEKICREEEEKRLDILVRGLVNSLSNFELLPDYVKDFDQARFNEDFITVLNQNELYFKLANDEDIRKKFDAVNFYSIDRLQESRMTIDENTDLATMIKILVNKNKFSKNEWLERGVTTSSQDIIDKMSSATNAFLVRLEYADILALSDEAQRLETVEILIDKIPWNDFESEERDFIFDEITPVLLKLEIDPFLLL